MTQTANLRVCASCSWVFRRSESQACPKCGFGHYGARWVFGNRCYRYEKTQEPWKQHKLDNYEMNLYEEIWASRPEVGL